MRQFRISYGLSDGQGPFIDDIKALDIQVALYQFARKHPNVSAENINSISLVEVSVTDHEGTEWTSGQKPKDPLGQAKKPSFVKWRMDKNNIPGHCSPQTHEVISWIEDVLL